MNAALTLLRSISTLGVTLSIPDRDVVSESAEGIVFTLPDAAVADAGAEPFAWQALRLSTVAEWRTTYVERPYVLPAGKLYFAPAAESGEVYLGETPGAELAIELKTIEVYGADAAVSELIKEIPYSVAREVSFKCLYPSDEVVGWFLGADAATANQTGATVSAETLTGVRPGRWYQLGVSETAPLGAYDITAVTVTDDAETPTTFVLGDDYALDAAMGRLYVEPGGAIPTGATLKVSYTRPLRERTRHAGALNLTARLTGALRCIAQHSSGPNRDLYAPLTVLRADGAVPIKRAGQDGKVMEFGFKARFQKTADRAAVYLDGRALA